MQEPIVSVIMITYNHEEFIEQAINSVLMQECNFLIELIIANDCSKDGTDNVVNEIINKHPKSGLIRYTKHNENLGMMPNFVWALNQSRGKYIALCEGDDYWIDPLKLQKQVDFLEVNPDFSLICHNAFKIIQDGVSTKEEIFNNSTKDYEISIDNILNQWVIPTASMLMRRKYVQELPYWFLKIYSGDFSLALILKYYGKVWFLNEKMSVYRQQFSGSSATAIFSKQGLFLLNQHIQLLNYYNEFTKNKYCKLVNKRILFLENEIKFYNLKQKGFRFAVLNMPFFTFKKLIKKIKNNNK